MKRFLLILLPFTCMFHISAQQFENISAVISDLKQSDIAWGDFDNDMDADIIACGTGTNNMPVTLIFQNNNGIFNEIDPGITGVSDGSVAWGDYDMDGDLDLLITGMGNSLPFTAIYANENGIFSNADQPLVQVTGGEGAWGDYDNDGDLDAFVTGSLYSILYENQEGSFVESSFLFPGMQGSSVAFGDYDNDGDLDIFLMGDTGGGMFSYIFENTNGDFVQANIDLEGLFAGTACWIDYDNDGDLDLNYSGLDIYLESNFNIYVNNGDGSFTLENTSVPQISLSTSEWGDMDNDGDPDLYVSGKLNSCGSYFAGLFKNNNGTLQEYTGGSFPTAYYGSAGWADFDNDGDLDLIVSGLSGSGSSFTRVYRNNDHSNTFVTNTRPDHPEDLQTVVNGNTVTLSWNKAVDIETPQDGLSYNIRMGYMPYSQEIVSAMSMVDGTRMIFGRGNVCQDTCWTIQFLPPGSYYWSVQTIDQGGAGSAFSVEENFTVLETGAIEQETSDHGILILNHPVGDKLEFFYGKEDQHFILKIFSLRGKIIMSGCGHRGYNLLSTSSLTQGLYILSIEADHTVTTTKFLKN